MADEWEAMVAGLRAGDEEAIRQFCQRYGEALERLAAARKIHGRRVLLIDDVLTTGATAEEATSVLLAGGAADVAVAVLARAESTVRK